MLNAVAAAIERYQKIVASGGWPLVPPGHMMRVGDEDPRVPILRKRLRIRGDMSANGSVLRLRDVRCRTRRRCEALPAPSRYPSFGPHREIRLSGAERTAEERLAQLKLNYDRLRGLMHGIEDRYVLVNIPAFQLEAVDKYEVQLRHRVIVGRPERETPEVRATIKALELFPLLARARQHREARSHSASETGARIPRGRRHPCLQRLQRAGTRPEDRRLVVAANRQLKFKQDPGEKNALGLLASGHVE